MRIDSHQHYWRVERGDYHWLKPENAMLYRDFGPEDLSPFLKRNGFDGTILVQAAESFAETEFMIGIAQTCPSVLGVVGWVDFSASNVADMMARIARNAIVKGVRPMVQDYADVDWLSRQELDPAFEALLRHDLAFDALVKPRNLTSLIRRLDKHLNLRVVIDHCAKPAIRDREFKTWAEPMKVLAQFPNVFCKLSGLITEAEPGWSKATLKPYVEYVLSVFGSERVMFGSDWPVVLLHGSYDDWLDAAVELTGHLTASEQAAIFGGNAARFYRVSPKGQ